MMAMIQKRTTTFVSFQPDSSKWWCSGDILKMRRPVILNEATCRITDSASSDEQAADEDEQDLLLDHHGEAADRAAEGERADVAHEDLGGMRVEPEEAERRADHRAAEDGQLAGLRHPGDAQVVGDARSCRRRT